MRILRLIKAERNQNRAAEWDVEFLTMCKKLRMTKKKAIKCIRDFRLLYEAKLLSHMACGDDRSYWSDYRHQRMALEFSIMTWPTDEAQVYRSHETVSQIAWIFQMGMSYRVGSDLYHWLSSKAAWVAANQGMTPMEERYKDILKKEQWDVSRKKLLTSIWMLKFAPMVRDKDVKRDASVLSSGCGDLTRTQTKVEFTDGMKEEY